MAPFTPISRTNPLIRLQPEVHGLGRDEEPAIERKGVSDLDIRPF